ncbi:hypothetical protein Bca52824_087163 [Brassica carinata]|uniref:Uncharacterized protein n=1 Tax=Brassica carinata TaxID=52824 RepID=A0A8X7PAC4_BRACI|nr:hypothetical protein Bca52824_087163 [Brassica carinata]
MLTISKCVESFIDFGYSGSISYGVPDLAWWCDLRPTKRTRTPIINLEESFDQNSVTRSVCTIKIKKEKFEKVASETRR